MIGRLILVLGLVFVAACEKPLPIAPTSVSQPAGSPEPPLPPGLKGGPSPIDGVAISAGSTIRATIDGNEPACFWNWDARGRCRQYNLTAPADGMIVATLKLPEPSHADPSRNIYDPEVFLVAPDGTWTYSHEEEWPERHASLPSKSAATYSVVVISYGPFPATFELTAELR